jgi:hypothetical protein
LSCQPLVILMKQNSSWNKMACHVENGIIFHQTLKKDCVLLKCIPLLCIKLSLHLPRKKHCFASIILFKKCGNEHELSWAFAKLTSFGGSLSSAHFWSHKRRVWAKLTFRLASFNSAQINSSHNSASMYKFKDFMETKNKKKNGFLFED